jgi:YjbE family integral membrane protein
MFSGLNSASFFVGFLQISGIDILLSGDNAVVIALASRSLPPAQRRVAVLGGSAAAIIMRIGLCLVITAVMKVPYLKMGGGLMLVYIGVKLLIPEGEGDGAAIGATSHVWGAIRTILIADAVMSLDNVVAIAAAAQGRVLFIVLGLVISIPLIVFGSQLVLRLLNTWPILVVLGAGMLGWIAGEIIVSDPAVLSFLPYSEHVLARITEPLLALLVMSTGTLLARRARTRRDGVADPAPEDFK